MLNTVAKRIQSRLSRAGVKVTLGDVKSQCEQVISDIENPTETELLAVQDYFMNNATTLTVINETSELTTDVDDATLPNELVGGESAIATSDGADQDYPEVPKAGELNHATQSQLITTTADQMGIVLDASEISLIAENINHSSDDFDQDIDAIRSAIMAFVNHKALLNQSKINEMIHEVRQVVGEKNTENSQLLSDGLRSINSDIQEANKQFKSSVQKCLSAFTIPAIKAG